MHSSGSSDSSGLTGLSANDLEELDRLLAAEGMLPETARTITARDANSSTPMSFSQELVWLLDRATPGLTAYNLPLARRLHGALDLTALTSALSTLVARHESLRTRFADVSSAPVQIIDAPAPIVIHAIDLSALPASIREREAEGLVGARARSSIDLANEAAFRVTLLKLDALEHVLLLETHHIVVDGWSLGIIFRELNALYAAARAGHEASLPVLPIQFGDFAAWQRERLSGKRLASLLQFWREQIGPAADEPLDMPTDFPRTTAPTFEGARQSTIVDGEEAANLRQLCQKAGTTIYMTLLAAYATVLHRYTGRTNVLIGSGSAGRSLPETENVVGYLNNTLVQRADFSGDPTFLELLGRVRASAVGAYDHDDIPLEKLVMEFRQGNERLSHAPLFEVVLTMQDTIGGGMALDDLAVEPFGIDYGATKFDITLLVSERDDRIGIVAQYRSGLFTPETMQRFLGHVTGVLASASANPNTRVSEILLLSTEEAASLETDNATAVDEGTATTVTALFETQAARVPNRVAVVATNHGESTVEVTYDALNARANQVAHQLQALGVDAAAPVALLLDRSVNALVALLGILKSGGAYVPLSVDAPAARIAQQLTECGASVIVTSEASVAKVPAGVSSVVLDRASDIAQLAGFSTSNTSAVATPDQVAYVLFTSGSTGTPKAVAVTHANAVHYARAISRVLVDTPTHAPGDGFAALDGLHFAMASTLAADLGNTSLLPSLLSGGTLHVLSQEITTDPARFANYASANAIDILKITPNHLAALAAGRTGAELASVLPMKWLVTGGEALRPDVARTLLDAGTCRVLNHYGPTETTVGVCTFEVTTASLDRIRSYGAATIPVGKPLANTRTYIVDANNNLMPIGIPGELLIGGAGVAQGYLKRDDLTSERFVDLRGDRVYRTGDRARRLPDGNIEFLGRNDDQVKVRGYRVELGEVEGVLRQHAAVANAAVVLRTEDDGNARLVAYVVLRQGGYEAAHAERASSESLRDFVSVHLPEYMVPAAVVLLDAIPLTPNGKLDRSRLPAPEAGANGAHAFVAPRTDTEKQLVAIWSDVLKKEPIGVTERFLDLGGHSLMAIRVLGKISKAFSVRLPLRTLFDHPTVEQLAVIVEKVRGGSSPATAIGARSRDAFRIDKNRPAGPVDGGSN